MAEKQVTKTRRLIIIGGSSGSLEALLKLLPKLHKKFAIPIIVVLHRSGQADNGLTELLAAKTYLQLKEADEKDLLQPGWIYLAPPDYHLLLEEDGSVSLDASQKVNYSRPSIDVSFISAAPVYKEGLTGVLLSGANADGALGMQAISRFGGRNIVQDPEEAAVSYMPEQAILLCQHADVLNVAKIVALLNSIAMD
ncbi:MAG: chemotaxis protein CheB [Ferruginibacter sp.]|uniref:chemotaxis protein CheB n=1 Tax=Ferruginibacter sp. TaxID=1940288 RepID=UPI002658BF1D|nr:chemotaxis protein CheB [Ferruginibacter sp.]MDB5276995.1 chemotaxis protein CheB [Ferruginibacter sp.]